MKRFVGPLIAVVAIVTASVDCFAQEHQEDRYLRRPHRATVYFGSGIGIPAQPTAFKAAWNAALPLEIGVGFSVLPWLDVNGVFIHTKFGANLLEAQRQIGFLGVAEYENGGITTQRFLGTVRFLAIPNHRANPFVEVGLGVFKTKADGLRVNGQRPNSNVQVDFTNEMKEVSGLSINFGAGLQYALNEYWSAFTKYIWTINDNGDFAPSNLIRSEGEPEGPGEGSQQFSSVLIGMMFRI